jgi:lysine-ketoglutarate reductase/saccharopine dehydrogenase-like protein (TIGR00300 family)
MPAEAVELVGHVVDSGVLSDVLDDVRDYGGDYVVDELRLGKDRTDETYARIIVSADTDDILVRLLMRLQTRGANPVMSADAELSTVERDGVFPEGFYSSTNLDCQVRVDGTWVDVVNPEMDCGIVVSGPAGALVAHTIPVSDVARGMRLVIGVAGVRVSVPAALRRPEDAHEVFSFMESAVSSEKPQALLVSQIADQMRACQAAGLKVLWVGGPAIVHTGGAPAMVALTEAGFVDVLFAGNALATHDIEASLYGTSLGVDLSAGRSVEHGHEHHIRAINTIRGAGSIAAAVESGVLTGGLMHALVRHGKPYVLVGSVRDDGPLPDVYTDVIDGQRAMRAHIPGVGFCLMVATMLHSVGTGNLLPASIPLVCVDINPATVTKLADRGSAQARGVVTDVGLFLEQLARELVPDYRTARVSAR